MEAKTKFPVYQYITVITGSLNVMSVGMQVGWPSATLLKLLAKDSPMPISNDDGSWLAVITSVGAFLGSNISAFFLDVVGRKKLTLCASILFCVGWITISLANNVTELLIGRFIGGIADGLIYTALPVYVGEISSPNIRGLLSSFIILSGVIGMLFINIISRFLDIQNSAIVAAVIPILAFVGLFFLPESPYQLIRNNNIKEANRSIELYKRCTSEAARLDVQRIAESIEQQQQHSKRKYLDLFNKRNRRIFFIVLGVKYIQQLTGNLAIIFYVETIFKTSSSSVLLQEYGTIIYFTTQVFIIAISSLFVDKFGRRKLMIISLSGTTCALFIVNAYFYCTNVFNYELTDKQWVLGLGVFMFVICFSSGMSNVPVIFTSEIFPNNVKAFAVCLIDMQSGLSIVIISKFFQFTKDAYGLHVPFSAFFLSSLLGIIFIARFVPETKNRTLEEIQTNLQAK